MIGQQKLVAQIVDLIAEDKFPRFSIVVGERGMEHEDIASYLAHEMNADYIQLQDVKVDTIREMIKQAYSLHHLTVYCIPHADDMSVNAKNALLKVIEDTPNRAYFVMCLEDLSNTLATIQSRGIVFRLDTPKREQIMEFARTQYADIDESDIQMIGDICTSPGEVCMMQKYGVKNFYRYAEYVADNLTKMSGAEIFKLSDKLSLKDEEDKYDVRLFLKALQMQFWKKCYRANWEPKECNIYCSCGIARCIGRYAQDLRIKGINKTMLVDNMMLEIRRIWKSQT